MRAADSAPLFSEFLGKSTSRFITRAFRTEILNYNLRRRRRGYSIPLKKHVFAFYKIRISPSRRNKEPTLVGIASPFSYKGYFSGVMYFTYQLALTIS